MFLWQGWRWLRGDSLEQRKFGSEITVTIKLSNDEFGNPAEREGVTNLEHELNQALEQACAGEVDGNEFGAGECSIFVQTDTPDTAEEVIRSCLVRSGQSLEYAIVRSRSSKELVIGGKTLGDRLLHPDWIFYERHLQRPVPAALRDLFADRKLITQFGLRYSKQLSISAFNPIDEHSLHDDSPDIAGYGAVPFANSDCGDPIYLRPGAAEHDKVYMTYHDDPKAGEIVIAESIAEMVEKLRAANPP
jgi:hypothetical protein